MAKYGKENMRKTQDFVMNSSENECLTIGSVIKVVDIHKDTYKGTVRSFDLSSRILSIGKLLPSPSILKEPTIIIIQCMKTFHKCRNISRVIIDISA